MTTYRCQTCMPNNPHEYTGEALMRHLAAEHQTRKGDPYKEKQICTLTGMQYSTDNEASNGTAWQMTVTDFIFENVTVRQFKQ